jgi:putative ABC transport system permease protein
VGRVLLVCRLAARDLQHRPAQAVLLLIAIVAATTTLTLGLALHGATSQPYQSTRTATAGPDVVVDASPTPGGGVPASLAALAHASGVVASSGPYLLSFPILEGRYDSTVMVEGRDAAPASVDQPKLTQGSWVRPGAVVLERSYADLLGLHAGDRITLSGRSFLVAGIAVTAAVQPHPIANVSHPAGFPNPFLVWTTRADARVLGALPQTRAPEFYTLNLKLSDPAAAQAFASAHGSASLYVEPWPSMSTADGFLVTSAQTVLLALSWLLGLLAAASVAVLAGGRMAEQTQRVGLLKAVGASPGLVAAVLLAEHLFLALLAAAAGLAAGWLAAPLLTSPGTGLVGAPGAPSLTPSTVALVTIVALTVTAASTLLPAIRAAHTSTVSALADAARPPRRGARLIALSSRLPVPLLFGLRLAARRPRRAALSAASVAVTVTTIVAVLTAHARASAQIARAGSVFSGPGDPVYDRVRQVLLVLTVVLIILAAVNAVVITWATVLDARHPAALARALGTTPQQIVAGLSTAQLLPAVPGILIGIPAGVGLYVALNHHQQQGSVLPPALWLLGVVLGTLVVIAGLTAIPARIGARRSVAEVLQAEG